MRHQLCLAWAGELFSAVGFSWELLLCELGNTRVAQEQRSAQAPHPARMEQGITVPQLGVRWPTWVCSAQSFMEGGISLGLPQGHMLGHLHTSPLQLGVLSWRLQHPSEVRSRVTALCPGTSLSPRLAVSGISHSPEPQPWECGEGQSRELGNMIHHGEMVRAVHAAAGSLG